MTTMNDAPPGYMPIPTAEQLADALANVRCFHDLSAELIAPELLANLLTAMKAQAAPVGERQSFADMTDVLIKRELLERCRARLYGLMQADLSTALAALLADHTEQHLEMVEPPVEVVGYLDAHDCLWNETTHPDRMIPLMTAGQHQRIMAASVPAGCKVVPDGYVVVPVEPTPEMAAQTAYDGKQYSDPFDFDDFRKDYAAMLAAAPAPKGRKMSDVAELMKRCQRGVGGRNALDEAHDIMAECYGTLGRLESERDALEAERDALRQQRDKLAKVLEDVEREHDLIRRMKNCELHRGRGSFGIAVMSDTHAIEWQALDKELQQFVDARRAALAASTGQEVE